MAATLRVALAQLNLLVGDIEGNARRIVEAAREAKTQHNADIIVFPELTLCGYPPEDLLLRPSLDLRIGQAMQDLAYASSSELSGLDLVIGVPVRVEGHLQNQAVVIRDGQIVASHAKWHLPNYRVFDEKRYFQPGSTAETYECQGVKIGLTVCEDIWFPDPAAAFKESGANLLLNLNASPFHMDKQGERYSVVNQRCQENGIPVVYVNQVGGQDELVFDGGSFVMNGDGELALSASTHEETIVIAEYNKATGAFEQGEKTPLKSLEARVYDSLVLGVRDYVNKNGFKGIVLGLSGGIDSALTLAVATDALGPDRVEAVMMPFQYTAEISKEDAAAEAHALGVTYKELPIKGMYDAFMATLADEFAGTSRDTTEENLQSRCRGVMLMAISNKKGYLVLTTGNKSEMAVGYATLYGDMAGGFDVLKDVPKTLVFRLSEYRNTLSPVIPQRVIDRPPSAELAPDQVDEDSLPPYDILDAILELYIEKDQSAEAIIAEGYERDVVYRILRLVDINEYKRRQAPVGVRITSRGFGKDRRYPITNGWRPGV
ncbi:NAD+ synthase [Parendozoicomonas haliclonae]|uniref:Glutamine-dependent NAD(+) synthetase n=1 Tax=Parendozoicomonas haliclonae TaxID=1960125 RepID=A0A1X7AQ62_9GAMM|nr:NAD+ synthase [Parendozoicomonas haliclonae]SMA50385.1 Glutamine-dependent NAD(+) synthetase [Parendozoicomonas haliclonae]